MKSKRNGLGLCLKNAPWSASAYLALDLARGLTTPILVLAVASFLDAASAPSGGGWMGSLALMAACYLLDQGCEVLERLALTHATARLRVTLRPEMLQRRAALDLAQAEDPAVQDLISLVCQDVEKKLLTILTDTSTALQMAVRLIGVLGILASRQSWTTIALAIGAAPLCVLSYRGGTAVYRMDRMTAPLTRRMYALSEVLTGRDTSAERTLFGFTEGVNAKFSALHLRRSNLVTQEIARWELRSKSCRLVLNMFVLVALGSLLGRVAEGAASPGLFVAIAGALLELTRSMARTLSRLVYRASGHKEYMSDFARLQDLAQGRTPEGEPDPAELPAFEGLEIKALRFRYPGSEAYVLDGLSLTLEPGKRYSLVGRNGAGKTTLTKILTGLYRDFEGEVLLNGRDIRSFDPAILRGMFSVVYQDFARYAISLEDNIAFGRNGAGVERACRIAGLSALIKRLPQGKATALGKVGEQGVDLSGGEWQRIAIARALYRDSPIMVLDEPTASLSPGMESQLYRSFAEIAAGHTLLFISHRLGSTKLSDTLLVLEQGRLLETGTHEALMAQGGLYAQMFASQRSWYDEA